MVPNVAKQQVLGQADEVRKALERTGANGTAVAKDLGVSRYGYGTKRPGLRRKLAALVRLAHRTHAIGGTIKQRCTMMASVLFGRCLCGSKCHHITECQLKSTSTGSGHMWSAAQVGSGRGPCQATSQAVAG